MKKLTLAILAATLLATPTLVADPAHQHGQSQAQEQKGLKVVEAQYVCMVNNAIFPKKQIPIEVQGLTYYGCCEMCKERLAQDAASRSAVDPLTGEAVDKAKAVIAADAEGNAFYFASAENLKKFQEKQGS
jgi:YHS domain-containing protein